MISTFLDYTNILLTPEVLFIDAYRLMLNMGEHIMSIT